MLSLDAIRDRVLDISRRRGLSHVGSCMSCLPILLDIYKNHPDDIVILSNGHAGLALYCVLEAVYGHDAEELLDRCGVHPIFDPTHHIYCSTGSLGMGLAVAVGYAMAGRKVHCVVSDGECAEGVVWESLSIITERNLPVTVYVNANGFGAYKEIHRPQLEDRLRSFTKGTRLYFCYTSNTPMPCSLAAHYQKIEQ